jgi:hypothetical protein
VTEPLAADPATLRTLTDRIAALADEVAAVPIPGIGAAAGPTLGFVDGPRRAAVELHRLGTALRDWAAATRRGVGQLLAADDRTADSLRH